MLHHAMRLSGNVSQTCRFFEVPRAPATSGRNAKPADVLLQVPGRSVELDVKFVPHVGRRARQRFYQFTAIAEAPLPRSAHLRSRQHQDCHRLPAGSPRAFLLTIQKIQTDNGSSFGPQLTWHLSDLHTSHKHILQERHLKYKRDSARKLRKWETEYNDNPPHLALKGKTPAERVRELVRPPTSVREHMS
jgi:hypothetical protein